MRLPLQRSRRDGHGDKEVGELFLEFLGTIWLLWEQLMTLILRLILKRFTVPEDVKYLLKIIDGYFTGARLKASLKDIIASYASC